MFIFTARLDRRRLILGIIAAVLLCGGAVAISLLLRGTGESVSAIGGEKVRTNADRIAYLERCGWTVDPESAQSEELIIPEEFDETYEQYLKLQSDQGFDLSRYCGKRVKRYTYAITNYPTGEEGVQASLLIYKNTVIGGEVLSSKLDGFIHGLELPA